MTATADAVVIGAGSVGLPTALFLAEEGLKVLVVERRPSSGQGENKAAIGGVRATHSDAAKIKLCQESLDVFTNWRHRHGDDIGWKPGGYCFPVFRDHEETVLKGILPRQKSFGLNIDWVAPERVAELIPGVARDGLRGGTYSPDDGQVSTLMASAAFFRKAEASGVSFRFGESCRGILKDGDRVTGVTTDSGEVHAPVVINAAGSSAAEVGALAGLTVPVQPDSHEAGITSPVEPFLAPLVVDLRPGPEGRTSNFYFGQNHHGAIIFCYTPLDPFLGTDRRSTSEFMPVLAARMVELLPRMRHAMIRRVWRGCYPMTPDGIPILGPVQALAGMWLAVGMCGQGFMLGPGVGRNLAHWVVTGAPLVEAEVLHGLRFDREFGATREALK